MRYVKAVLRFCYDFVIGDDWRIAAGVVAVLGICAALVAAGTPHVVVAIVGAAGILAVVLTSILATPHKNG